MERVDLAKAIFDTSHITGEFKLRSGQTSKEYFDKYRFEANPHLLREIASHLAQAVGEEIEVLAGLEMGGIPIATALAFETGLPVAFVRKEAKAYGTCKLAEGADIKGKKLLIIEDVITTGGQVVESAKELRDLGAIIESVLCVINRGPKENENLKKLNLNMYSLFTMEELKA